MRTCSIALSIITLTVVASTTNSQVASKGSWSIYTDAIPAASILDAAMKKHSCLKENAVGRLARSHTAGKFVLITVKFESFGACETAVSIDCLIVESDQLFTCNLLDNDAFEYMDALDIGELYDAPAHSQEPTELQLIQDEMNAPVTDE